MATTHTANLTSLFSSNQPMFPSSLPSIASSPPRCVATSAASFRVSSTRTRRTPPPPPISDFAINQSCKFSCIPLGIFLKTRSNVSCAVSMADGGTGGSGEVDLDHIIGKVKKYWGKLPQPVKTFPWSQVLENFIQLVFDLTVVVIKCLSVPLLAISSLSELSYCAHERKLRLVPIPLIIGFAVGGFLRGIAEELSPIPKDAAAPWHLITLAIFFLLLKLPGPYYPYGARIFIPHFANGGLLRILWFVYLWYRRSRYGIAATA
ncbi:hypothetical protein Dimus_027364 [Dionaea muscipula]